MPEYISREAAKAACGCENAVKYGNETPGQRRMLDNKRMTTERLAEIQARVDAATHAPWEWDIHTANHECKLQTSNDGKRYVMGFKRWGTQGAVPMFQKDFHMQSAAVFAKSIPGKEHHEGFDDYIDHPDALFIAAARADIPDLLAAIRTAYQREETLLGEVQASHDREDTLAAEVARLTAENAAKDATISKALDERDQARREREAAVQIAISKCSMVHEAKKRGLPEPVIWGGCCAGYGGGDSDEPPCEECNTCGLCVENSDAPDGAESEGNNGI